MNTSVHATLYENATANSSINTLNETCWICHENGKPMGINSLHTDQTSLNNINTTVIIENGGGNKKDCIDCHDSGSRPVDVSAMNDTDYIHYNLNNNSSMTLNSANAMCWGCHANAPSYDDDDVVDENELPDSGHPTGYKTPKICTACHDPTAPKFGAKAIYEHNPDAPDLQTSYTCVQCHNNSIMDYTDTKTYINGSGDLLIGKVSHYANKSNLVLRENFSSNDAGFLSYCKECHNSSTKKVLYNLSKLTDQHGTVKCGNPICHNGSTSDNLHKAGLGYFDLITYTSPWYTDDQNKYCFCHGGYASTNAGSHGNTTSSANCTVCHMNRSVPVSKKATPGAKIPNVEFHSYYDGTDKSGIKNGLAPGNTSLTYGTTEYNRSRCYNCHDQTSGTLHNPGTDCILCHPSYIANKEVFHSTNVSSGGGPDCILCHDTDKSGATMYVDVSAINGSINGNLSIHRLLNSNMAEIANSTTGNPDNSICWGCHDSKGYVTADMGDRYEDPYQCYDCHSGTPAYENVSSAPGVFEHFYSGGDLTAGNSTGNDSSCLDNCHNLSEMKVTFDEGTDNRTTNFSEVSHYGKKRTDLRTWTADGLNVETVDCKYCHDNDTTVFKGAMQDALNNSNISEHSLNYPASTPNCTNLSCHAGGWMHNASLNKPDLTTSFSDGTPSSLVCLNCHGPANYSTYTSRGLKQKHNNTLNCTECHLYRKQDIHGVKYLQQDDTYSTSNSSAVDCQVCHASDNLTTNITAANRPKVPTQTDFNFIHSEVSNNGSRWNSTAYWTTINEACEYCHNDTKHAPAALGRITSISSGNIKNTTIDDDNWCAGCHYKGDLNYGSMQSNFSQVGIPPEITNGSNWQGIYQDYYNHSLKSYIDNACQPCHGIYLVEKTTKEFPHRAAEGVFGANCTWCHDLSSSVAPRINVTAVNSTFSIHANVSTYSAISNPYLSNTSDINKVCWLCHMNDSGAPANYSDHADRIKTTDNNLAGPAPFNCDECHIAGIPGSVNASVLGWAPDVVQHFAQGSNLTAGNTTDNLTSCRNCHNLTRMKVTSNLPSIQGLNSTGWLSLVSHYGKVRSRGPDNIRTWEGGVDCSYCHQNGGNEFGIDSIMASPEFHSTIPDHSLNYDTPANNCSNSTCHNGGWMHNTSLKKPALMEGGAEDSSICLACHSSTNSSIFTPATGAKEKHNNTLDCTECHLYEQSDIHGVRYLQSNDIYTIDSTSSLIVNCEICHDYSIDLTNISMSRPFVPTGSNNNFSHSNSLNNGSLWGSYWNNANEACEYCHRDTKHNTSALGRISIITGTPRNSTDLANTTWCRSCHYNDTNPNYLNMNSNFKADNLAVPPEITNGTNWNGTSTGYFNHTISNFNDSGCQACHGQLLSIDARTSEFPHTVGEGQFGPDCITCHDLGGLSPKINFSAVNTSLSLHQNIRNYSTINNPFGVSAANKICWACHMNESESPVSSTSHAERLGDFNGIPVYTCIDCHISGEPNSNLSGLAPDVAEHFYGGRELKAGNSTDNLSSCLKCHNLTEMKLLNIGPVRSDDPANASYLVAHYGKKRSTGAGNIRTWNGGVNCSYCHQSGSAFNDSGIMVNPAFNSSIQEHSRYDSSPGCTNSTCHNSGWMHNNSLQKPDLTTNESGDSRICLACHGADNFSTNVTYTTAKSRHNGSLNCTECHLYRQSDIHDVKYLQSDNTYTTDNLSSLIVDCKICHNYSVSLSNISVPRPFVPTALNNNFTHGSTGSAGSVWGTYWSIDNGACIYCHKDSKHNTSALGRISNIKGSATNSTDLASTGWCRGCHYNDSSSNYLNMTADFKADVLPIPPEITNGTDWKGMDASRYFNHSIANYNDSGCRACHGQLLSKPPTTGEFPHNVGEGQFGPDCIKCHDMGGVAPLINVSITNSSSAIHSNISTYDIDNPYSLNDDNRICWACHMDNGQSPTERAHADRLGDYNSIPVWTCVDCHVGSEPYVNLTGLAPDVFEHFFGGIDLKAGNSTDNLSSCLKCHNVSEMKLLDIAPVDASTGASYFVAHYGKKRSAGTDNIRTWNGGVNCSYCHQNSSSAFAVDDIMVNKDSNSSIFDHSRYSSTPNCTSSTCHNGGWMHNDSLQKPGLTTLDSGGAEDSRICLACHGADNFSTNVTYTTAKAKHNGSLNCSECHLFVKQDIHGVKYLQSNDIYTADNTSSLIINCEICHDHSASLANISMSGPFVPTGSNNNFNHSEDPDNGSRWANASVMEYWNNTNQACEFCHNDTKHETDAFGRVSVIKSTNNRNQTIDSGSRWCRGCHYRNADNYYVTGNFSKIPPTIFYNSTQLVNSTDDVNNTWFNHTLSSYSDDLCRACHGGLLSSGARSNEFVHNVGAGKFGSDCVECHALTSSISPRIDVDVLNFSLHTNINNNSPYTGVLTSDLSKACWGCHGGTTDGNPPPVHPFLDILPPRICEDCHTTIIPSLFNAPLVSEHGPHALDVETNATNASCVRCHNNSVNSSVLGWTNITDEDRISHYGNIDNLLRWVTKDCKYCHYDNPYNVSWGYPMDPRITITNFNHSIYNTSSACYYCHAGNETPIHFHAGSVTGGAGRDCVSCHDIGGAAPTPKWLDVSAMNNSKDIHYDLNRRAIAATSLDPDNVRCWACHGDGDGTEAEQPEGHPLNYSNPRICSNNDCHAVNQSIFGEPMVYEHFKYADSIDEDIETSVDCEVCHNNSLQNHNDGDIKSDSALVSHYGSTRDLINSSSCIYCHLDEDNSEKWGDAPDPLDNESTLSETERNATIYLGEKWHIGSKYILYFKDISKEGDAAYIQILSNDKVINESIIEDNEHFVFTRDVIDKDGDEIESVIFSINITAIFRGYEDSIITIKGRTMKRIHTESIDESCYACHLDIYTLDKSRYLVLDKDNDNTYYTELYVDFEEDDIDQKVLSPTLAGNIVILEGYNRSWTVDGYEFIAKDIDIEGDSVYFTLKLNNVMVSDGVYDAGETIEYDEDLEVIDHTINEVVLFRADVVKVFHGLEANAVMLSNVRIISNKPEFIDIDDEIGGYNASWLQVDDIFSIKGAPENLHVPPINDGVDGGPDCVMCHDFSAGFGVPSVNAISTSLGGHEGLNKNAVNRTKLTDTINQACWACHGEGTESQFHPVNYLDPRECQDCHVNMEEPTYGAVDLSDEAHGQVEDCKRCHAADYPGLHVINVFEPLTPYIVRINVNPEVVRPGRQVNVSIAAMSGWNMKVKAIEYFIDTKGEPGTGIPIDPVDGTFNEQVEEAEFTIDTSGYEPGNHTIYLRSLQRDDKWGPVNNAVFSITEPEKPDSYPHPLRIPHSRSIIVILILVITGAIILYKRR